MPKLPLINTHTHIFTDKNIAPLIAKSFVPWPFYYFLHIGIVFRLFKFYKWIKKSLEPLWSFQIWLISSIRSTPIIRYIDHLVSILLTVNVIIFIINWSSIDMSGSWYEKIILIIEGSIVKNLLLHNISNIYKIVIVLLLFFLYPKVGKLLFLLAGKLISQLKYIPSKKTIQFIQRYLTIAEFAKYKTQKKIFDRLIKMYEPGSKIVVLPMDMEEMGAGTPSQSYLDQLKDIDTYIHKKQTNTEHLIPFVFVDPRRIRKDKKKGRKFFEWDFEERTINNEKHNWVVLKDCVLKDCLEGKSKDGELEGNFKGIKIYPALGYYPFDKDLLPLWLYCQQRNIPITTHCIEGTIFYRGKIKRKWMHHPIFKDAKGNKLNTRVKNNYELQTNFTHALNYLILLEEHYLSQAVGQSDEKVKLLFGYDDTGKIKETLSNLKINLAHYGGKEEWMRYLGADRKDVSAELMENPSKGLELFKEQEADTEGNHALLYSKPAWIWSEGFEWFTIISSLMLQYPNVYADISYILHSEEVKPLLYQVLKTNNELASKILFGTDFFVVRNHKSEKELYADLLGYIGMESMDLIARTNPHKFLSTHENLR